MIVLSLLKFTVTLHFVGLKKKQKTIRANSFSTNHPDVAPRVALRVVEGGNGGHLSGFGRGVAPLYTAAKPPRILLLLVDDDGATHDGS